MSAFGEKNGAWYVRNDDRMLRFVGVGKSDISDPDQRLVKVEKRAIYEQVLILKEYLDHVANVIFQAGIKRE